jgi:hypothetical protein
LVSQQFITPQQYGAIANGTTDDTAAIAAANAAATTAGRLLFWPAGTYLTTGIAALAGMTWIGESSDSVTIKLADGANSNLVTCATLYTHDITIKNITFDGNSANNSSGGGLDLAGASPVLENVRVNYTQDVAITTRWDGDDSGSTKRINAGAGYFNDVIIDTCKKTGWEHYGPNDSQFNAITIIDVGLVSDDTYNSILLDFKDTAHDGYNSYGNGTFANVHIWTRNTNIPGPPTFGSYPSVGMLVRTAGNTFTACDFEAGYACVELAGGLIAGSVPDRFANSGSTQFDPTCQYYAARRDNGATMIVNSSMNIINGAFGVVAVEGVSLYCIEMKASTLGNVINITNLANGSGEIPPYGTYLGMVKWDQGTYPGTDNRSAFNNITAVSYQASVGNIQSGTYRIENNLSLALIHSDTLSTPYLAVKQEWPSKPIFSAYQTVSQVLGAGVWTKIVCDVEAIDNTYSYESGTGPNAGIYTITQTGYYIFTGSAWPHTYQQSDNGAGIFIDTGSGAALFHTLWWNAPGTGPSTQAYSQSMFSGTTPPILLAAGTLVEYRLYCQVANTTAGATGRPYCYFGGHML